jgi:hypothetical protein
VINKKENLGPIAYDYIRQTPGLIREFQFYAAPAFSHASSSLLIEKQLCVLFNCLKIEIKFLALL